MYNSIYIFIINNISKIGNFHNDFKHGSQLYNFQKTCNNAPFFQLSLTCCGWIHISEVNLISVCLREGPTRPRYRVHNP